ncbi:hypothetical protein P152DRAFT_34100 [Eremomyces bilateralis CBS 781.70]|uniref:Secreted protein n=1 Tax=Eremomyces bilateralis CBS 781.70 TaxID=1392243 RepID=A0A6G1G2Q2_9PEZI|nr:uncharacterized protein P152DRAFT_34100 [Eremomyces bilateralis CBS 781.70]KAF1812385.1 hypothetical protein P152DRAFT_34100 [Eremomyces bilateralis CBS 781.70]
MAFNLLLGILVCIGICYHTLGSMCFHRNIQHDGTCAHCPACFRWRLRDSEIKRSSMFRTSDSYYLTAHRFHGAITCLTGSSDIIQTQIFSQVKLLFGSSKHRDFASLNILSC